MSRGNNNLSFVLVLRSEFHERIHSDHDNRKDLHVIERSASRCATKDYSIKPARVREILNSQRTKTNTVTTTTKIQSHLHFFLFFVPYLFFNEIQV